MGRPLRILVLYWHHESLERMRVGIRQHLGVLESSEHRHELLYYNTFEEGPPAWLRHLQFDAVLMHNTFLCMRWANFFYFWKQHHAWIADLKCPKLAMPQDEYDHAYVLDEWLYQLGTDVIISNFTEPAVLKMLYPLMHDRARFEFALTGYLDDSLVDLYKDRVLPIKDRPLDVVYRASHLPYWFGSHGQVKWEVGHAVDRRARLRGMQSNISTYSPDVIVGYKWLDFLASSRAITGTEGGSSVIDRRGERKAQIEDMLRRDPSMSFADVSRFMPANWNTPRLPLIGPRHLEAAMTRTCQILVDGTFCGVLESGRHFIPIKPDYSNIDEVLDQLEDYDSVQKMVDRSFEELCLTGRFSRKNLARTIEQAIEACARPAGGLSSLLRPLLWPLRARAGIKANDSIDLKISDEELQALGEPYLPEPQCRPDLEEGDQRRTGDGATRRIALSDTIRQTADALVIVSEADDASRWQPWVDSFSDLPAWRVYAALSAGAPAVSLEREGEVNVLRARASEAVPLHRLINHALSRGGVRRPLVITDSTRAAAWIRERSSALTMVWADARWLSLGAKDDHAARMLLDRTDLLLYTQRSVERLARERFGYTRDTMRFRPLGSLQDLVRGSGEVRLQAGAPSMLTVFVRAEIDARIDFALLEALCERMPAARFWFSGAISTDAQALAAWSRLLGRPNARYVGDRHETWKWFAWQASVALLVTADEACAAAMAACGLPLVASVEMETELPLRDVRGVEDIARTLEEESRHRHDPAAVRSRRDRAMGFDVSSCLREVERRVQQLLAQPHDGDARLNVLLVCADDTARLWPLLSRHHVYTTSVADALPLLEPFDAIIVHASAQLSIAWEEALSAYGGVKLFHAPQADLVELGPTLARLGVQALMVEPQTVLSEGLEGLDTLACMDAPIAATTGAEPGERPTVLTFRAEFTPLSLEASHLMKGLLETVEQRCRQRGVAVDLHSRGASEEASPLLSRTRAVLITQTRANIFDARGNLRDSIRGSLNRDAKLTYDEAVRRFLRGVTHNVRQHALPRLLEAISRGAVLILLEGDLFDAVLIPEQHYLVLKRDLSNLDEVIDRISDAGAMAAMAERVRQEVIEGYASPRAMVARCDEYLSRAARGGAGYRALGPLPRREAEQIVAPAVHSTSTSEGKRQ